MFKYLSKKLNKKNRGFTLVELIVVIAILAILAAIAVPALLGFQDRARQTADQQTAAQVKNAVGLLWANGEIKLSAPTSFFIVGTTGAVAALPANMTSPALVADLNGMLTGADGLVTNLVLRNDGRDIFVAMNTTGQVRAEVVNTGVSPIAAGSSIQDWLDLETE